jgi:hypothetical protein
VCVESASQWYEVGAIYMCHKDHNGTYFVGRDGLKDDTKLIASKFKEAPAKREHSLTVVK